MLSYDTSIDFEIIRRLSHTIILFELNLSANIVLVGLLHNNRANVSVYSSLSEHYFCKLSQQPLKLFPQLSLNVYYMSAIILLNIQTMEYVRTLIFTYYKSHPSHLRSLIRELERWHSRSSLRIISVDTVMPPDT